MLELLSRYWWTVGLRGLSAVTYGLIAVSTAPTEHGQAVPA